MTDNDINLNPYEQIISDNFADAPLDVYMDLVDFLTKTKKVPQFDTYAVAFNNTLTRSLSRYFSQPQNEFEQFFIECEEHAINIYNSDSLVALIRSAKDIFGKDGFSILDIVYKTEV